MANLWQQLKQKAEQTGKAFTVLAPMEDVTDTVFRRIVISQGRPDLLMTEFTNCDGLASRGRDKVIHRLEFIPGEHPLVAQIWGRKLETYVEAVSLIADLGFDGIDINMGCPVPKVIKSGAGSGLIRDPSLAQDIILAVREAIRKSSNPNLAFSVKTRIGFNVIQEEWVKHLLTQPIDALTLHLRTRKELSKVPAHWETMQNFVALRDSINPNMVLIGNGDITTKEQLNTYKQQYGVDGLMIGRGIFDNLWLFNEQLSESTIKVSERLELLQKHIEMFQETWSNRKNFEMIKKFFKIYLKGFEGAAALRNELIVMKNADNMLARLQEYKAATV